jgi:hypothetical protein
MTDKELSLFRQLVLWLFNTNEKPWEYSDAEAREIFDQIGDAYTAFADSRQLEQCLPAKNRLVTNFRDLNRFLYLQPLGGARRVVPIMTMFCNLVGERPEVRIRLGLFLQEGTESKRMRALGLRFETPEGDGRHNYFHAQFITEFSAGSPVHASPHWLPTREPAFLLDADSPLQLMICLLISLNGLGFLDELEQCLGGELAAYTKQIHAKKFAPSFWRVLLTTGALHYYRSWVDPKEFRARMTKKHPGCRSTPILRSSFMAQPENARRDLVSDTANR